MHFSIKNINGKKYHYASDYVYIAKGENQLKNKSLGGIETPLEEMQEIITDFKNQVVEEEVEKRKKYWTPKIKNKKAFKFGIFKSLESFRSELYRGKESLNEFGQNGLEAAFSTDFIYNSNKLEGSRVPRKTIENAIRKGSQSNDEVVNSLKALEFTKETKNLFAIRNITKLHKILLAHEPAKHGIRKEPIIVGNSETLPFEKIPKALNELLAWLKKMNHKMYPPELAFEFYYRFERIHPFKDGNGRTGRLLMNEILKEHRYHPIIIWNNNRVAHMTAFEKAIEGHMHKYLKFTSEQMKTSYDVYLNKIKKAAEIEKSINETFFTPSR